MKFLLLRLLAYLVAAATLGPGLWAGVGLVFGYQSSLMIIVLLTLPAVAVIGVLLWRASLFAVRGIRVTSPWTLLAMDAVCLLAAMIAGFFIVDYYSAALIGAEPLVMTDEVAHNVILIMIVPAAFVLALFTTSSGGQSLAIEPGGVELAGAFGRNAARWDEIEAIRPQAQYVPVSRAGAVIPSHLRTNMELIIVGGDSLTVYEPGLKRSAELILARMRASAPSRLQAGLDELGEIWLKPSPTNQFY